MESLQKARNFLSIMQTRRSTRRFSTDSVCLQTVQACIQAAASSPSGANRQPWFFGLVTSSEVKKEIRIEAEKEELLFYNQRANDEFLSALRPFGTTWSKPHLEEASALIVIFSKNYSVTDGSKQTNYYATESTGIATGVLISALHHAGLNTLTHTPSPMNFLNTILGRPKNERAFLILAVGYAHPDYQPPQIEKKSFKEVCTSY